MRLYHGDLVELLPEILAQVREPATFWLGAHYCGGNTAVQGQGWHKCPLMLELKAIAAHPVKLHHILIDDVDYLDSPVLNDISQQSVIAALRAINHDYHIQYEDGKKPCSILTARP